MAAFVAHNDIVNISLAQVLPAMATIWLIPKGAEKPADRRRKKRGDGCDKDSDL